MENIKKFFSITLLKNNMNNLIYWFLDYFFILLIFDLHCSFDNFSIPSIIWSTIVAISFYLTIIYFSNTTISFWIGTIILFIYGTVSAFKITYLGSPFVLSDLSFTKDIGGLIEMVGVEGFKTYFSKYFPAIFLWFLLKYLIYTFLAKDSLLYKKLYAKNKNKTKKEKDTFPYIKGIISLTILLVSFLTFPHIIDWNTHKEDTIAYVESYGVIGGLYGQHLISAKKAPETYNREIVQEILDNTQQTTPIWPENVDVVVVLCEAFWNPNNIPNYTITSDPMTPWNSLKEEGQSFNLHVPIYGGQTVNTEFELLTGYSLANDVEGYIPFTDIFQNNKDSQIPSLGKLFTNNGYNTIAISPFYVEKIFACHIAYEELGFQKTYLWSDYYDEAVEQDEIENICWFNDSYMLDKAKNTLTRGNDFVFVKTVENHMPYYNTKYDKDELLFEVTGENEQVCNTISIYSQGVYNNGLAVKELWEELKTQEQPIVLIAFGDHLPSLTDEVGNDILQPYWSQYENEEMYMNKYTTECVVLTNFEYDKDLFLSQNNISPCTLSSAIACATFEDPGKWFIYTNEYAKTIPVNSRYYTMNKNNELLHKTNNEYKDLIEERYNVQWGVFGKRGKGDKIVWE